MATVNRAAISVHHQVASFIHLPLENHPVDYQALVVDFSIADRVHDRKHQLLLQVFIAMSHCLGDGVVFFNSLLNA
jgi:hypothetical protein